MKNQDRPRISLRQEREKQGLSITEVSEETRIPLHYIEALESGDLTHVQKGPFLRSYKHQYLHYFGLPKNAILKFRTASPPSRKKNRQKPKRNKKPARTITLTTTSFLAPSFGRLMLSSAIIAVIIVLGLRLLSAVVDTRTINAPTVKATQENAVSKKEKSKKSTAEKDIFTAIGTFISASPPSTKKRSETPPGVSTLKLRSRLGLKAAIQIDKEAEQLQLKPNKEKKYEFQRRLVLSAKSIDNLSISYNGQRIKPQGSLSQGRKLVFVQDRQDL